MFGNSNVKWVGFSLEAVLTETPKVQLDEQQRPCKWLSGFIDLKNGLLLQMIDIEKKWKPED